MSESAERKKLRKDIADNEREELDIKKRMDQRSVKQQAHNATGRLLDEQDDNLRAELRENHAAYRNLRFQLNQTE